MFRKDSVKVIIGAFRISIFICVLYIYLDIIHIGLCPRVLDPFISPDIRGHWPSWPWNGATYPTSKLSFPEDREEKVAMSDTTCLVVKLVPLSTNHRLITRETLILT